MEVSTQLEGSIGFLYFYCHFNFNRFQLYWKFSNVNNHFSISVVFSNCVPNVPTTFGTEKTLTNKNIVLILNTIFRYCFATCNWRFVMLWNPVINFNQYRAVVLPYIINVESSCLYPYIYLVKIDFEIGTTQNVFLVWHQTWFSCWLRYWDAFLDLLIWITLASFAHAKL